MISNSDLEKAWFLYKTEYEPKNVSVNAFCVSKGIPYRDFNNWFSKTHKQVVPLEVEGMPVDSSASEQPERHCLPLQAVQSPGKGASTCSSTQATVFRYVKKA